MALHLTPEEHDADPPGGWTVRKVAPTSRRWQLLDRYGNVIATFDTKHEAEAAKTKGPLFDLYEKEGRWFKGETPPGWKTYVPQAKTTTFRTRDGVTLHRLDLQGVPRWWGNGRAFNDLQGVPVDANGQSLRGTFVPDPTPEEKAQIIAAWKAGWDNPIMNEYDNITTTKPD